MTVPLIHCDGDSECKTPLELNVSNRNCIDFHKVTAGSVLRVVVLAGGIAAFTYSVPATSEWRTYSDPDHSLKFYGDACELDVSYDSITAALLELKEGRGSEADEEDKASQSAIIRAIALMKKLGAMTRVRLQGTPTITEFQGSIRLVWESGPKILKFVIPSAEDRPLYAYNQGDGVNVYDLKDNPTDDEIITLVRWFSSPAVRHT